jgi:hypothetical protein
MAKRRSKKQVAAFKRMVAGLRRWKAGKAKRRRKSRPARARRRKTIAIETNPRRRRRHRRRQETMAKRRRRPRRARRQVSSRRRRRSVVLINPRHRRHHRRRRNPGFSLMSAAKDMSKALLPGFVAGGVMGAVDAKFLGDKALPIQVVAKMALAAVAGAVLRKRPTMAYSAMGAILGATGYGFGVRLGGGVVAATKGTGMQQLAQMAQADQHAMGLLLRNMQGMGILVSGSGMNGVGTPSPGALPDLAGDGTDDSLALAMRAGE